MTTADAATRTSAKGAPVYERLVLKLSGESLSGPEQSGIHADTIQGIAHEVKEVHDLGVQVAIMVGGGNIFRGTRQKELSIDRATGDYMGMLATVINGLALQDALEKSGCHTRLMSAIEMHQVAEPFIRRRATRHLEKDRVVIFAAGTGNPYFSTDTAAALRAMEIKAQVILKATRVDGVYDADPEKVPGAKRFENITYLDVLQEGLVGDGFDGDFAVHGQQDADRGVQHECARESEARGAGRTGGIDRQRRVTMRATEATSQMTTIATSKDALEPGESPHGKSRGGFPQGAFRSADRTRERIAAGSYPRGLSRHADARESAGHAECAGRDDDRDCALGPERCAAD